MMADPAVRAFVFTGSLLLALLLATGWAQLPAGLTPAWLKARAPSFDMVWPQGWSFFADTPTATAIVAYQWDAASGDLVLVDTQLASAANWWGLGRTPLTVESQIWSVAFSVPRNRWRACDATLAACVAAIAAIPSTPVANPAIRPALCGPTILAKEAPSRWEGDRAPANPYTVQSIAPVDIRC